MKIAVMGEIHQDGWEVFRKINADSFELFNFDVGPEFESSFFKLGFDLYQKKVY